MIAEAEWPYYYDSKAARKFGLSVENLRRMLPRDDLRSMRLMRANGSSFYILNRDDVDSWQAKVKEFYNG